MNKFASVILFLISLNCFSQNSLNIIDNEQYSSFYINDTILGIPIFSNNSFLGEAIAQMEFKISILIHHVDTSWIEPTLFKVKDCLTSLSPADHVDGCEIGSFLAAAK